MAEDKTKKKSTVKSNTTKKTNNTGTKKTSTQKKTTNVKNSTKTTTTKKSAAPAKKATAKKAATTQTTKKTTAQKKTPVKKTEKKVEKIVTPVEDIKEEVKYESINKDTVVKEEKVDIDPTEVVENVNVVLVKEEKKTKELSKDAKDDNEKRDKLIDVGILIAIIGLFILVLTAYLATSTDLSYTTTNNLVMIAVGVQAIALVIIICNIFRRK